MSDVGLTGQLSSRRSWWAWQWFTWPIYAHQYTTESIWRPGNAPFRTRAWQPDVSGWTVGRFAYDMQNWSDVRGRNPDEVLISMNTGTAWRLATAPIPIPPGSQLVITTQYFPASGTYTPPAGLLYAEVECAGGGGGGGGVPANPPRAAGAGGGGSGALSRAVVTAAQMSGTVTVTVGNGGLGVSGAAGTDGAPTSFGAFATAPGGVAGRPNDGTFSNENVAGAGGPGGPRGTLGGGATGLVLPGNAGGTGFQSSLGGIDTAIGGIGGAIIGGVSQPIIAGGSFAGFAAAPNTGAGGSGGIGAVNQPAAAGGNGGSGYVFVTEFSMQTVAAAALAKQLQPFGV